MVVGNRSNIIVVIRWEKLQLVGGTRGWREFEELGRGTRSRSQTTQRGCEIGVVGIVWASFVSHCISIYCKAWLLVCSSLYCGVLLTLHLAKRGSLGPLTIANATIRLTNNLER